MDAQTIIDTKEVGKTLVGRNNKPT